MTLAPEALVNHSDSKIEMERLDSSSESQQIKESVENPSSQKIVNDFLADIEKLLEAFNRGVISDNELKIVEGRLIQLIEDLSGKPIGWIKVILSKWINKDNQGSVDFTSLFR